jgi:hypothetical protein
MAKTFHLLGLSHVVTNKTESLSCAFSQKVLKMGTMLKSLGHRVLFYGNEGSTVDCDEFIQVQTRDKLESIVGHREKNQFYNLTSEVGYNQSFAEFMTNTISAINSRKSPNDFLLCPYGSGHQVIADNVKIPLTVESGIGYGNTFAPFRVFESYAWMHYLYGVQHQENGINYDCVIPNYFDPFDFEYSDKKQDYMLYIGRMIHRKGVEIAMQLAEHTGIVLKMAGQLCGEDINYKDRKNVEYLGYADWDARRILYRDAMVTLVPTQYFEPFGGVSIESLLSGTPVISTDWGVFTETIIHGLVGYRCRTWDDYLWAIKNIGNIKSEDCRQYAIANFSMDRVKWMYEEYFNKLLDLLSPTNWYTRHDDRKQLDWLRKTEVTESRQSTEDKQETQKEIGTKAMPIHQICSGNFSYEYYLSVMSALQTHKYSEYNLWIIGEMPSSPYLDLLEGKINIKQVDLSFLGISSIEESKQFPAFTNKGEHFIRVHIKDIVAWDILYKYGGLFMDLDTLSIQDCHELYNKCKSSCFFGDGGNWGTNYNVAVMIAKLSSEIIAKCRIEALKKLDDHNFGWGDTGPNMLNSIIREMGKNPLDMFMPVGIGDNGRTPNVTKWFNNDGLIWDQCRVLHTYASGRSYIEINEMFIQMSLSPYAKLVKQILSEHEWNPFNINSESEYKDELLFWSHYSNHICELDKQSFCAKQIGIFETNDPTPYVVDLQGKSVLEIGAGPNGLCLRAQNGRRKVIDPAEYPEWVWDRYKYFGVEYENIMAENMNESGWDEVWLVNCMQHVTNPDKVMENIKKAGKVLRIFEWLNIPVDACHHHTFTREWYDTRLNTVGNILPCKEISMYTTDAYYGVYPIQQESKTYTDRAMMMMMIEKEGSNPLTGIEIGVLAGQNAVELLTKLNIQKLYLIDPYKQYDSDIYTQAQLDEAKQFAHAKLEAFKDRIQWIPMGSSEAIAYFIDNDIKVDFVYCDGGHAKDEVLADINNYYPIATKYIGGHDYMTYEGIKEDAIKYPGAARGVNDAVIEYTKNNGLVYYCAQINHADWWIDKTKQGS